MAVLHSRFDFHKALQLFALLAILLALPLTIFLTKQQQELRQRAQVQEAVIDNEEFVGPFPSWGNVKRDYGAVGNGIANDTLALQRAFNEVGTPGKPAVMYIPSGTYRITNTLLLRSKIGIGVIGEHPDTTKIQWDTPTATTSAMLWADGVARSRFGRITWDGANKVERAVYHGWDQASNTSTGIEHADEVFKNANFCLFGGGPKGANDDTFTILRSKFINCSEAGVAVGHQNALQYWVWYSTFENNKVGVTSRFGNGSFHVYNSIFRNSTEADIQSDGIIYGIHNNFSIGSKMFFDGYGMITLQGNTIIDPQDAIALRTNSFTSTLLFDNTVRSRAGQLGPVVTESGYGMVSVGNTFTVDNAVSGAQRTIDDRKVNPSEINATPPTLPSTPPNLSRRIFEVPTGADAPTIQGIINRADTFRGQRPVVHFPERYSVDQTITIPANSDIQLVGDNRVSSGLLWSGAGTGPVLRLDGPARATLRDLTVSGTFTANGIVIEDADQLGARVFMDQPSIWGNQQVGLLADRLDNTDVSVHDLEHVENIPGVSVKVIGGPRSRASETTPSRVAVFGETGGTHVAYDVLDGGKLLVHDGWQENNYEVEFRRLMKLTGSGTFSLSGTIVDGSGRGGPPETSFPMIEIDNFQGKATFLNSTLGVSYEVIATASGILVKGDGRNTNVLAMGMRGLRPNNLPNYYIYTNTSPNAKAALIQSTDWNVITGIEPVPDNIRNIPDMNSFIRDMLEQVRTEKPKPLTPIPQGITDVRLFRVNVDDSLVGIHIKAGPTQVTPTPTSGQPSPTPTRVPTPTPPPTGRRPYPDGSGAKQIPGTIQAEDYDIGGEGVSYHDTDSINQGGAYRSDGVDVKGSNDVLATILRILLAAARVVKP